MKNFKKVLSLILVCAFILGTVGVVNADLAFSDLPGSHWGYSYVQTLVGDGTINGYADGTFRPEANVTRAEFVKMIGKVDKAFDVPFDDIAGHWAYDYIMYSDMDVEGSSFNPDVPITRNDVINLLWKRAGSKKATAPSIITNQSTNADAAAWAYSYEIMNGDDGINLRLQDGVTRAEASALICRSRTIDYSAVKSFSDTVNPKIIEDIYNSFNLFGDEYNADRTFTNGEIATAAMRLIYETSVPTFEGLKVDFSVNRPNTFAFYAACYYVWGESKMTEEFYDAKATNIDTIAILTFAANCKFLNSVVDYEMNNFYDDIKSVKENSVNAYITAAYKKGIKLDNNNHIYPDSEITAKNLALVLMQIDALSGFNSSHYLSKSAEFPMDARISTDVLKYPNSRNDYQFILTDVPTQVYDSPFIDENGKVCSKLPKDFFEFARNQYNIFTFTLQGIAYSLERLGADVTIVYYPSMVCESDKGYVMKLRIKLNDIEDGKTFDDVFPNTIAGTKPQIKDGDVLYMTLATGSKLNGLAIPTGDAVFTSIDYIY